MVMIVILIETAWVVNLVLKKFLLLNVIQCNEYSLFGL